MRIAAAALLLAALASPADAAGLTSPEALAKVYELILDARFDDGERQLKTACPPAPQPGCAVVGAVADYWRLLINPEDTSPDTALLNRINGAISATEAWVAREPKRAEAWFYLGGAYGTRVLFRGLRGQYLSAARDGRRIHDALQLAISLDPSLGDAYFGLGLYHYYAAIAPRASTTDPKQPSKTTYRPIRNCREGRPCNSTPADVGFRKPEIGNLKSKLCFRLPISDFRFLTSDF